MRRAEATWIWERREVLRRKAWRKRGDCERDLRRKTAAWGSKGSEGGRRMRRSLKRERASRGEEARRMAKAEADEEKETRWQTVSGSATVAAIPCVQRILRTTGVTL